MAKGNPLQEQLLKAGLVKKSKVSEVAREQQKSRIGKAPPTSAELQRDAERRFGERHASLRFVVTRGRNRGAEIATAA